MKRVRIVPSPEMARSPRIWTTPGGVASPLDVGRDARGEVAVVGAQHLGGRPDATTRPSRAARRGRRRARPRPGRGRRTGACPRRGELADAAQALALEGLVADGEHLVEQQDVGLDVEATAKPSRMYMPRRVGAHGLSMNASSSANAMIVVEPLVDLPRGRPWMAAFM